MYKDEINNIDAFHSEVAGLAADYNISAYYLESGDGTIFSKVDHSKATRVDDLLKETMENRIDAEIHKNPEFISTFA